MDRAVADVTRLLQQWSSGQEQALVNEAFLKLIDQRAVKWQNRANFSESRPRP